MDNSEQAKPSPDPLEPLLEYNALLMHAATAAERAARYKEAHPEVDALASEYSHMATMLMNRTHPKLSKLRACLRLAPERPVTAERCAELLEIADSLRPHVEWSLSVRPALAPFGDLTGEQAA